MLVNIIVIIFQFQLNFGGLYISLDCLKELDNHTYFKNVVTIKIPVIALLTNNCYHTWLEIYSESKNLADGLCKQYYKESLNIFWK
jgi:hypothetical protein